MTSTTLSAAQVARLHDLTEGEFIDLQEMAARVPELLVDSDGNYYRQSVRSAVRLIRDGRADRVTSPDAGRRYRRMGMG